MVVPLAIRPELLVSFRPFAGHWRGGSFVQHWLHRAMFFEASESTFTIFYILFFAAVASSLWLVKPHWPAFAGEVSEVKHRRRVSNSVKLSLSASRGRGLGDESIRGSPVRPFVETSTPLESNRAHLPDSIETPGKERPLRINKVH
jgi:hypothetical protein